jgi:hypothetical protein
MGPMEIETVDVFIDENGQVKLEVRGVKGGACRDLTAPLEAALGGAIESREMTAEALESTLSTDQQQNVTTKR